MGKYAKWVGGGLGWVMGGPLGALAGFFIGSMFETPGKSTTSTIYRGRSYRTTAGDFAMSLIVLVAAVMKADGKILKSELDFVKDWFKRQFGEDTAAEAIIMLRDMLKKDIPVQAICQQISRNMEYTSRIQLVHMLFEVSASDGEFDQTEVKIIERIARYLNISSKDMESIKNMFLPSTDSAYKILDIDRSATDGDVKRAYRRMARKYHPDTINHLGDDFKESANEKFRKVNEAYENIKKERNIN